MRYHLTIVARFHRLNPAQRTRRFLKACSRVHYGEGHATLADMEIVYLCERTPDWSHV